MPSMTGFSSAGEIYLDSHHCCVFGLLKFKKYFGVVPPPPSVPQGSEIGLPDPGGDCSQSSVSFIASRNADQKVDTTSVFRRTIT